MDFVLGMWLIFSHFNCYPLGDFSFIRDSINLLTKAKDKKILFLLHSVLTIFHWFLSVCRASSAFPLIWVLYEAIINLFKPVKLSKLLLYKNSIHIDYNFLVYAEMLHGVFFSINLNDVQYTCFPWLCLWEIRKKTTTKTRFLLMAKHWGE